MFSNAAAWSACSPGDMTRQVAARGRVRDFGIFDSQTTEGDPDETGLAPLPCRYSCDYGTRCLALDLDTFQPILQCKMTCSVTGKQCSGRYHACCVTEQETQDSMSILPPNACGLPQCIQGARRETAQQKFAYGAGAASGGREGWREGGKSLPQSPAWGTHAPLGRSQQPPRKNEAGKRKFPTEALQSTPSSLRVPPPLL